MVAFSRDKKQFGFCNYKSAVTARQSASYLLRFWRITDGALRRQSRLHVPQARSTRFFLALLGSNAPKLLAPEGERFYARDKANERSRSQCATSSEFNAVSGLNIRPSGEANTNASAYAFIRRIILRKTYLPSYRDSLDRCIPDIFPLPFSSFLRRFCKFRQFLSA